MIFFLFQIAATFFFFFKEKKIPQPFALLRYLPDSYGYLIISTTISWKMTVHQPFSPQIQRTNFHSFVASCELGPLFPLGEG